MFGPDHSKTAESLNNIAVVYQDQRRFADAEPVLQRALAIFEKQLGPEHSLTAITRDNLAKMYQAQGQHPRAMPLWSARPHDS